MATATVSRSADVPAGEIAAHAADVDRAARFPRESLEALRSAGLLGLSPAERQLIAAWIGEGAKDN
jgi:alkylation response protein AidB-like acyl-CoA dehydrogenase